MKRFIFSSILVFSIHFILAAQSHIASKGDLNIIPKPFKATPNGSTFHFNKKTVLLLSGDVDKSAAQIFLSSLHLITNLSPSISHKASSNFIRLAIDSNSIPYSEGYLFVVDEKHVSITGHDAAGVFYGLQSLIQLAGRTINHAVPGCIIEDHPRFAYRGMHLDVSRHFFTADQIKKWIDVLALYKINTFHWHLTDDQGWRIEIKRYPRLQSVAAYRNETLVGHKKDLPHIFDGQRYGGYYTQDEVRQVVKYAAERHITIIPEIEMPGHAMAALTAYPNLGCTGGPYQTATYWGVFSDVYCAGNNATFVFLQDVLDEVLNLFPSKYIHIGGDECPKQRWHTCPKCQKRMADENLKDESELQSYFIKRIERYLNSKGRQIIGWDEILEGGLSPGATVMSWTGEKGGIAAAKQQHQVVMTPEKYVYLDYYQSLYPDEQLAAGGYLPLKKIYSYEPIPSVLDSTQSKYILGVQANVWSEYLDSKQKAEYMMFPRMLALAETAWSSKENRDYIDFLSRLRQQYPLFKKLGIHAANVFDEITYTIGKNPNGKTLINLDSTLPHGVIHYTTNGTAPGLYTPVYHDALVIDKGEIVKAAVFKNDQQQGRTFQKRISFHKAVGKPVTLTFQPAENYNPGDPSALVNGIEGSNLYNDGQWFGFSGANLEAVIDLGSVQKINLIGTNVLKYHWQRMWEPTELSFWVSSDGTNYTQVYSQKDFAINGINIIKASLKDTQARYIKVVGINKGIIPEGEYGAGAKAMLLVDEIFVY
ncbi:glycoside hydrolase family 20 protein [Mucilaginibacter sp. BT774]|uniref:glycoside hydrolase family 20 protein n=1 Tax=Mucilaginibacter sp. BT774 TaxID=3062276 RepID=UPI00267496CC|nr:glycoside hydrolase family 20 protein [Mucilaginibacter sp. BT774]MDO3627763.1 glycoside hydrolase family 20 protein [Mucilaginibacter sp. BT774]